MSPSPQTRRMPNLTRGEVCPPPPEAHFIRKNARAQRHHAGKLCNERVYFYASPRYAIPGRAKIIPPPLPAVGGANGEKGQAGSLHHNGPAVPVGRGGQKIPPLRLVRELSRVPVVTMSADGQAEGPGPIRTVAAIMAAVAEGASGRSDAPAAGPVRPVGQPAPPRRGGPLVHGGMPR